MLLDILGIAIAFSSVMLLLALLVTAITQGVQATFRLRARNLQRGLASLLADRRRGETEREPSSSLTDHQLAREIMNAPEVVPIQRRKDPNAPWNVLRGPLVSWIKPEALLAALKAKGIADSDAIAQRFQEAEDLLRRRFTLIAKVIALVVAVVVGAVFQVSTPDLLRQLSADPALRARYVEMAPDLLASSEGALDRLSAAANTSGNALAELTQSYPEIRERVREIPRDSQVPGDVSEALALAVEDLDQREQIVDRYEELVQEALEAQRDVAAAERQGIVDQLSLMSITPLRYGWAFYCEDGRPRLENILGVLVTAIFLSLGAPFWFNLLQNLLNLKDQLDPTKRKKSSGSQPQATPEPSGGDHAGH